MRAAIILCAGLWLVSGATLAQTSTSKSGDSKQAARTIADAKSASRVSGTFPAGRVQSTRKKRAVVRKPLRPSEGNWPACSESTIRST